MRRIIVVAMLLLFGGIIFSDFSIIQFLNGSYEVRQGVLKISYIHYLFFAEYAYEIVFFKILLGVALFIFWLLQLKANTYPLLLRRLTSCYTLFYLAYFYMFVSIVYLVLKDTAGESASLLDINSILINSMGGADAVIWYVGPLVSFSLLLLILPIWHLRQSTKP